MEKVVETPRSFLPQVARCHREAFGDSLASALGRTYVCHMLSWYLSSPKTFIFHVADENNICTGYCGGMVSDGTLNTGSASGMAQYTFWRGIWAFLTHPWVVFHPEVRAKLPLLWKNLLMKLGLRPRVHFSPEKKKEMARDPHVGLVVIGVDPKFQGRGIGSLLLQEFERRAALLGIPKMQLTVRSDNAQAIRVYERNGWVREREAEGSLSMVKRIDLGEQRATEQTLVHAG
jgi:GNAT superfamily N-acetyltransferase